MKLVSALLCKNEAATDRYLQRVLERCLSFSDAVLVLDDRSTDATAKVASSLGCRVFGRSVLLEPAWGTETPARRELWELAAREAGDGWVLFCDADMLLHGDPRPLCYSRAVNAWAFILYDVWSEDEQFYRSDGYWQAHRAPRPWLFRPSAVPEGWTAQWSGRGIHCGHAPVNFPLQLAIAPPTNYFWLHLAYAKAEHRLAKHRQYMEQAAHLSPQELAHANSICE